MHREADSENTVSATIIRFCTDRVLPDELLAECMQRAIEENPSNAAGVSVRSLMPGVMPDLVRTRLAAFTGKLWRTGRCLRVRFLNGDPHVFNRIPPFAHVWSDYANITFEFGDDPDAEIRISFDQPGSWSYLGTDALVVPKSKPTMNFGWLTSDTPDEEYSRVVSHEFGHVLGCIHEHQNPVSDIPWNREAVYDYYQGPPNYWTHRQIDVNIFERYGDDITQFSSFDKDSIMLYPIPSEFTLGGFHVGWNRELSETDKQYVVSLYPLGDRNPVVLAVNGPVVEAEIGHYGELDEFLFQVAVPGVYQLETGGETDVVLSLFGPNDPSRFVSQDDDSGQRFNARIVKYLRSGEYMVRIRHFSQTRTGKYSVGVTHHSE